MSKLDNQPPRRRPGSATPLEEYEAALVKALPSAPSDRWLKAQQEIAEAGSFFGFASIYEEAARVLALHAAEHPVESYGARQSVAVVFLHRHCLELILKQMVRALQTFAGHQVEAPRTHRLRPLWDAVSNHLRPLLVVPDRELRALEQTVELFEKLDPSSETSRYPVDARGRPLDPLPPVDLEPLQDVVTWFMDTLTVCLSRLWMTERTSDDGPGGAFEP